MKRFRVSVSPAALEDVEVILRRVQLDSPQNAAMLAEQFATAFESLREYPERCVIVPESDVWKREVRCLMVFRFRVLFAIRHEEVTVLRVLHGSSDALSSELE